MNKVNYILTYWLRIKLKRRDNVFEPSMSMEDNNTIVKIYEDYEERKKLKKIKFSILFNDNFNEIKNEK